MVNRTPHDVVLFRKDGTSVRIPADPSGPLRLTMPHQDTRTAHDGIPIAELGVPKKEAVVELNRLIGEHVRAGEDVIVPLVLLFYVDEEYQQHVFAPDTGPGQARRDSTGRVIGSRRLIRGGNGSIRMAAA